MANKQTVKITGCGRKSAESESLKQERLTESYGSLITTTMPTRL